VAFVPAVDELPAVPTDVPPVPVVPAAPAVFPWLSLVPLSQAELKPSPASTTAETADVIQTSFR
jgi:hypothetical protein